MKTILITITLLVAACSPKLLAQRKLPEHLELFSYSFAKVPAGKIYFVYDGKGKKVAQFRSGQKTNMTTDCAMIKCPSTFGQDVVCWKCMGFTAKSSATEREGHGHIDPLYSAAGTSSDYSRVPNGKTYVVYNAKGKKAAQFRSGQKTNMSEKCVQVPCTGSDTSGQEVVCWKCPGLTAR